MFAYLTTYVVSLISLIVLDAIFLGVLMRNFYSSAFGDLMKSPIDFRYAVLFYVLYTVGVLILVIMPALQKGSITTALMLGAVLGVIAYMTYDLTGAATIKGFPTSIIIIDILWGGLATAIVSSVGYQILLHLTK